MKDKDDCKEEKEFLRGIEVANVKVIGKSTKGYKEYQYRSTLAELLKNYKEYLDR